MRKISEILIMIFILVLIAIVIDILIKNNKEDFSIIASDNIGKDQLKEDPVIIPEKKEDSSESVSQENVVVEIYNDKFLPSNITILKGVTISWINKDFKNHKISAQTILLNGSVYQEFYSDNIPINGQYNHTFNNTGNFPYFDVVFLKYMKGSINVLE